MGMQRFLPLVVACGLLTSCSQAVTIEPDFPTPIITPLPLVVGLHFPDELTTYVYSEEVPNDTSWTFDIGAANDELFNTVFPSMFQKTVRLDSRDGAIEQYPDLDAVIEPAVEAFEFSLPRQSRTEQYAVWIRYNVRVYAPDGDLITTWPVSAYGQSDSRFSASRSMERATIKAMRDAAATIALGFGNEPRIKDALLQEDSDEES